MRTHFALWTVLFWGSSLTACLFDPAYVPPPRLITCTDENVNDGRIAGCKTLADQGSSSAAAQMGLYYDHQDDTPHAYEWYRKAAERGDLPTIRKLYDDYRVGTKVPRNEGLSSDYLNKAAGLKAEWALLLLAKQNEFTDPIGALETYLSLARNNNCFAQARLAVAYYYGDITPRNVTQSYFWGLLATSGSATRKSDYHVQTDLFAKIAPAVQVQNIVFTCADVKSLTPKMEAEASLPPDRRQLAQDAATSWTPGLVEPLLPQPVGSPVIAATTAPFIASPLPTLSQSPFPAPAPDSIHGRPAQDSIAMIIGIDGYEMAPRATFAERDASAFKAFAVTSMGIAEENIKISLGHDARRLDIERVLTSWLPAHIKTGRTNVIVYFAGHGLTSDDGTVLYLLPYDGDRDLLSESALRRDKLIDRIKTLGAKHITLFLDTCYSGLSRDGDSLLPTARPIVITAKKAPSTEDVTIFSAAQGNQVSLALKDAGHGLYSYMLMKGMEGAADANGDHRITAAEIHTYAQGRVTQESTRLGHKQIPAFDGDGEEILVRW